MKEVKIINKASVLLFSMLLVLFLCTCLPSKDGNAKTTEMGSTEQKTVRMWTFLDPTKTDGRSMALKKIIDKFQSDNANIKIAVEPQDWEAMTPKFFAAHSAGNAPDIIWCIMDEMGAALDLGALEPLENLFLKDWTPEQIADIDDAFWDFGERNGKHYQVTHSRNYIALYYRQDLFDQFGISAPKTWEEFIKAAQTLTGKDPGTGIERYGFGQAFNVEKVDAQVVTNYILEAQGTLFTPDGKANWSGSAAQEGLQFQIDCIKKYKITPEIAVSTTGEELFVDFCAGKYAMITGGAVRVPKNKADATFDPDAVQIMQFPSKKGDKPSPATINGWCVGVWSGSNIKNEAGKFVEAMMSPFADELWLLDGGQVPVRKSTIITQADFLNNPKNRFLTVMAETFANYGWPQPTMFKISGWKNDLNSAMQYVMVDGKSVKDALLASEELFNKRNKN
jgi:multiple sugar transport system substrate-binding protein